jgi:hypothetical protein
MPTGYMVTAKKTLNLEGICLKNKKPVKTGFLVTGVYVCYTMKSTYPGLSANWMARSSDMPRPSDQAA